MSIVAAIPVLNGTDNDGKDFRILIYQSVQPPVTPLRTCTCHRSTERGEVTLIGREWDNRSAPFVIHGYKHRLGVSEIVLFKTSFASAYNPIQKHCDATIGYWYVITSYIHTNRT